MLTLSWRSNYITIKVKTDCVSKSNLSSKKSQETHGINKYPQRIDKRSIPEGDSSMTCISWSLNSECLGVFCTNPPLWEKEKWNADFKEKLRISIFSIVKRGIKCFQINPTLSLKFNLK